MHILVVHNHYSSGQPSGENRVVAEEVLEHWITAAREAVAEGYEGLRITGNTAWVKREQWSEFVRYEGLVTEAFQDQPILALCSS